MPDDDTAQLAKRVHLLQCAAQSPELQALLLAQCQRDILFWFNHFCWTFDPRVPQPHRPFRLYPYQVQALRDIVEKIQSVLEICQQLIGIIERLQLRIMYDILRELLQGTV